MTIKNCKTCKYWVEPESYTMGEVPGVGKCIAVVNFWDAAKWVEADDPAFKHLLKEGQPDYLPFRVLKPEYAAKLAFVQDASNYSAQLKTKAEFGCVQHEPKA